MTRQTAIVNMSNWDGEDYLVEGLPLPHEDQKILKPGESVFFTPKGGKAQVTILSMERKTPKPFRGPAVNAVGKRQDHPLVPRLNVTFEKD